MHFRDGKSATKLVGSIKDQILLRKFPILSEAISDDDDDDDNCSFIIT